MLEGDGFAPQWVQIEASLLDEQLEACRAIMVNINEQVQAEEALRKSESNLQLTLDATTDGIWEWNFKTNVLFFSPRYYTMLGYDPGELPATYETWENLIHPDDLAGAIQVAEDYLEGKPDCYENEFRMRSKTAGYRWIRARSTVVERDEHGAAVRIIGNHEDITERKQAEQELRVGLEKYKVLFESFPLGITMTDKSGNILEANIEAERLLGIPQAEHTQRKYDSAEWQIVRPDGSLMPANEYASVQALRENRLIENVEMGIVKDKGNITWISVTAAPIPLEDYGVAITYGDITERKRAEEMIRKSEGDLARIVETVPNGIMMVDSSGKITFANHAAEIILGLEKGAIADRSYYDPGWKTTAVDGGVFPDEQLPFTRVMRTNKAVQGIEHAIEHPDGTRVILSINAAPLHDVHDNLVGMVAALTDITERTQFVEELHALNIDLEQRVEIRTNELIQTNIELEHANRIKDEFLATMSHELRTPLNSILGLSELLLEQRRGSLNDHQQKSLQIIEFSGQHLLELINDILDLSKIDAGKFDFYPQIIDVVTLCRSSLTFIKEQAMRKSITITYKEDKIGSEIYADPRRLKQILVNLLINAVKFTPDHGQVTLQVQADEEEDRIQFSVIDNGIGISSEDLERLFQPFMQIDSSLNRQFEGTGLGLALVQRLTDLHGGSVHVESEVGVGSRFTINLPWRQDLVAQQETIQLGGARAISEKTGESKPSPERMIDRGIVLLAEDNPANILTIGDYLESHGYQLVVAHDGLEAIEKAEENTPNIILMDIQMPAMNGLEAIRRLRADSRFATTPIIALTALAMPGDRERCLEAGATEYMSKPVSLKGLVETINSLL